MLLVSSAFDAVAQVLDTYAKAFGAASATPVVTTLGAGSSAVQVRNALSGNLSVPLVFFGHGVPSAGHGVVADDKNAAIDPPRVPLLSNRTVVAISCHGDQLGVMATAQGFNLLGFQGVLRVPLPSFPRYVQGLESAFLAGPLAVSSGNGVLPAAQTATQAFSAMARMLLHRNLPGDGLAAVMMSMNASRVSAW